MGQFLQVNGDYNIKAAAGSRITLDTGPAASGGEVRITGDLIVEGETVTVEATDLAVEDNIILLNKGETGAGITLNYAGIQIDRGSENDVAFLYDDITNTWLLASSATVPNALNYSESNLRLRRILTDSETDGGNLTLIGTLTGVVNVLGTDNYENQVTAFGDDAIPNKKYVDDSILNNPTFQIVAPQTQDTRVIIADKEITPNDPSEAGSLAYFEDTTSYVTNGESAVSIIVDGVLVSQFYNDRLLVGDPGVDGIEIDGTNFEIRTESSISDQNILIKTAGTGKLQTNYALQLDKVSGLNSSSYVSGSTVIYAKTPDIGQSGVWFLNDSLEEAKRTGELISKNKALVFSMLF
jgi:hypothetical protein